MTGDGFLNKRGLWLAALYVGLLVVSALASPAFFSGSSEEMNFTHALEAPSAGHVFGTDSLGRDLFLRILRGGGVSLGVGVGAVAIAVLIGTVVGAAAGYYGGYCEKSLMGFVDVMLCFPSFFMILAVSAVLGPGAIHILWVIGVTGWMGTARLVRAEILSLKEREFILAAQAMGAGGFWIITRHLIPNVAGPVIVNAVLGLSAAILMESGLSFLGIGVQPPTPSWGNLLMDGKATLGVAWWMTLFPGMVIFLTVLSVNVLGERLAEFIGGERREGL